MTISCAGQRPDGGRCRSWPIRGEAYCLWHSPDREEEAAEARRLGGLRRRREKAVSGAYDIVGLDSVQAIRRILEIATIDILGLENSLARSRTLISAAVAAARLLETGELEARIAVLEAAVGVGRPREPEESAEWP
ncbi:MAG TPA: hypothetical protein VGQ85_08790 [Candidatus Limnocylindrales bacterium]|nr:hypothetical protein [Candidatus Limnocylindrales bacterium]